MVMVMVICLGRDGEEGGPWQNHPLPVNHLYIETQDGGIIINSMDMQWLMYCQFNCSQ